MPPDDIALLQSRRRGMKKTEVKRVECEGAGEEKKEGMKKGKGNYREETEILCIKKTGL